MDVFVIPFESKVGIMDGVWVIFVRHFSKQREYNNKAHQWWHKWLCHYCALK